jgi:hypothetical protein
VEYTSKQAYYASMHGSGDNVAMGIEDAHALLSGTKRRHRGRLDPYSAYENDGRLVNGDVPGFQRPRLLGQPHNGPALTSIISTMIYLGEQEC